MKRFYTIFSLLFVVFVLFTTLHVFAQVPINIGPGDGDGTEAPLGFIEVLAVAGGGYAIKKLRDKNKQG